MVNVAVTIPDNDSQTIQLIPSGGANPLVLQESPLTGSPSTSSVGVRLGFRPSNTVTVSLASMNTGASGTSATKKVTLSPSTLTFGPSDYAVPKTVTLTAPHDADMLNETAAITASSSGVADASLNVSVLDIDVQNILNDIPTLTITDPVGPSPGFKVWLTVDPATTPVTVNFASSNPSKVTLNPSTCTFMSGNYTMATSTCQIVASAVPDADGRDEMVTVTGTSGSLAMRPIAVTVKDNDVQALIVGSTTVVPPATSFTENGSVTFPVSLALDPIDPVTISVFSNNPAKFDVSPPSLTFTSADYSKPHLVTIRALDDDDLADEMAKIFVTGAALKLADQMFTVMATDDDHQVIIVTPTMLTMLEGATTQIGVRLAYRPSSAVPVGLMSGTGTKLMSNVLGLAPSTLSFDSSNFAANQFVTVTAPKDNDTVDDMITLTASATGATSGVSTVTVTDTDVLSFKLSTSDLGTIDEDPVSGNHVKMFTVQLNVNAAVSVSPTLSVSAGTPVSAVFSSACTLKLATDSCTAVVTATTDPNAINEVGNITVAATGLQPQMVNVAIKDKDTMAFVLSSTNVSINEKGTGSSDSFTVKLNYPPAVGTTVNVSVSVMPAVIDGITLSSTVPSSPVAALSLSFDSSNFNTPQTIPVTGVPDLDLRTDPFSIRVSATNFTIADQFVSVTEVDQDTQSINVFSASGGNCGGALPATALGGLSEGTSTTNGTLQFCVSLSNQPLSNTVVDLSVIADMAMVSLSTASLTFTTTAIDPVNHLGWSDKHLVTLTAMQDDDASNGNGTVNLSSSGFAATKALTFTTTDNEAQSVHFNPMGGVTISKATGTSVVWVRPAQNPLMNAVISCGTSNTAVFTVTSGGMYTFSRGAGSNYWMTEKPVTLTVAAAAAAGNTATLDCSIDILPGPTFQLPVTVGP
jgi:hypothetical protein